MKRMLFILSAVLALASTAPAAEMYVLRDGKVEKVESKPEAKPVCICGDDCKCKPGECPGKCPVEKVAADVLEESGHWEHVQECQNGRCTIRKVWVPNAKAAPAASSECASCASCSSASSGEVMNGGFFRERRPVRRLLGAPFRLFFGGFGCCR